MKLAHPSRYVLRVIWLLTALLLSVGLVSPIMTMTQFVFFDESFSIVSGIWQLYQQKHYVLFLMIGLFSVVLPLAKMGLLLNLLSDQDASQQRKRWLKLMHDYGRWAMLDVMVVAMLIVMVKLGAIVSITIHSGLYVFGSAVLLIMYITHHVVRLHDE
jgi:paraquat-inducible protein A